MENDKVQQLHKKIGKVLIQAVPVEGMFNEYGYMGMKWTAIASIALDTSAYIDCAVKLWRSSNKYDSPEYAVDDAEKHIDDILQFMESKHLKAWDSRVHDVKALLKAERKNHGYGEVISQEDFNNHNFYTDDDDYIGYPTYNGKVLELNAKYDEEDMEDIFRTERRKPIELAAAIFGCQKEDIQILLIDYPECK